MKKIILSFSSLLFINGLVFCQDTDGKLKFEQGQTLEITLQTKTTIVQQVMGQAIDINAEASGTHAYKVTNTTEDNHTLNHMIKRISFSFDGMGQKQNFDSDKPKDLSGQMGKPIKEMLDKKYDMIIDPTGKVMMAMPESFKATEADSRMALMSSMMRDVIDIVNPPQKGKASFFKILPDSISRKGTTWTTSSQTAVSKTDDAFVISDINDSTIVIDFVENSMSVTKADIMGSEATTTLTHKSTGKIILDRVTNIMREKTMSTESSGNVEGSFGALPVSSKTTTTVTVRPVPGQ